MEFRNTARAAVVSAAFAGALLASAPAQADNTDLPIGLSSAASSLGGLPLLGNDASSGDRLSTLRDDSGDGFNGLRDSSDDGPNGLRDSSDDSSGSLRDISDDRFGDARDFTGQSDSRFDGLRGQSDGPTRDLAGNVGPNLIPDGLIAISGLPL